MQHPNSSIHPLIPTYLPSQAHTHTHTHHPTIEFPSLHHTHPTIFFCVICTSVVSPTTPTNLLLSSPTRPILISPRQPLFISRLGIRSLILCCSTSSRFENVGFVDVEIVFCYWWERGVSVCEGWMDGWMEKKKK